MKPLAVQTRHKSPLECRGNRGTFFPIIMLAIVAEQNNVQTGIMISLEKLKSYHRDTVQTYPVIKPRRRIGRRRKYLSDAVSVPISLLICIINSEEIACIRW